MRTSILPSVFLSLSLGVAVGCGGGGGGGAAPITITLDGASAQEGTVSAHGAVYAASELFVGVLDNQGADLGFRAFLSFELAPIPVGAHIQAATLIVYQAEMQGHPYAALGSLFVDHVVYGTILDAGAYTRSPIESAFGALSNDAALGPKSITVTSQVQLDLDGGHPQTQYRLRFPVEHTSDLVGDGATIDSTRDAPTPDRRPHLIVTYAP